MVMKVVSILASAAGCLTDGGLLTGAAVRNVESNNSLWTGGDDKEKKKAASLPYGSGYK
jgi:hypothetical protein